MGCAPAAWAHRVQDREEVEEVVEEEVVGEWTLKDVFA